ncbi:phenylacetaldoxime dehydratase family protein [Streptomyces sp. NPDC052721]|uniref:phenylacetaldoxime dehydratase family protein n=1 Tax=Streptomyces sp. NPDC052721 TaxID=3154955 RepID=UPI0034226F33
MAAVRTRAHRLGATARRGPGRPLTGGLRRPGRAQRDPAHPSPRGLRDQRTVPARGGRTARDAGARYWGAGRDRIAASATEALESALPVFEPQAAGEAETLSRRVTVEVPGNVALIRTAQDWSAGTLYREKYLADVKPVKDRGVDFLATHPESGCIAARNIAEESTDGAPLARASTVAWFASLDHLMTWCRSHRTHLEIYARFFQMIGGGEGSLDVAFWHEVSVLPSGSVTTEYVNCHPRTGFLPLTTHPRSAVTA